MLLLLGGFKPVLLEEELFATNASSGDRGRKGCQGEGEGFVPEL